MPANATSATQPVRESWRRLARQAWSTLQRFLVREAGEQISSPTLRSAATAYEPLQRVLITDGVGRTLFKGFAEHRTGERAEDETGWMLLGLRERDEAIVLATLPAGTQCDAGVAHVRFNSTAQAVGSRMVRQSDKRLTILGVVHTHPGSLRHPSDGDYQGDSQWVRQLRGREGIFGIGTADVKSGKSAATAYATHPHPNVQILGELCFSWYSLRPGQRNYAPLPLELTIGPDLARPLHDVWSTIEEHAERLDRLYRQQIGVSCEVIAGENASALLVNIPLAEPGDALRVLLYPKETQFYLLRQGQVFAVDPPAENVDQAVYLMLAELSAQA